MNRSRLLVMSAAAAALVLSACGRDVNDPPPAEAVPAEAVGAAAPLTGDQIPTAQGDLVVHPIEHASLILGWSGQTIYVDPVGGAAKYAGLPAPSLILVTDIHGDHLDAPTLAGLAGAPIVAPQAVYDQLPPDVQGRVRILGNGDNATVASVGIEAVPMYNTTPDRMQFHEKGRGNGYVLTLADKHVYIAGDTEATDEMKALQNIDVAFIPMNLPYTMTAAEAAAGVNAFKPRIVYPYHYRGTNLEEFKSAVEPGIEVRTPEWYPGADDGAG